MPVPGRGSWDWSERGRAATGREGCSAEAGGRGPHVRRWGQGAMQQNSRLREQTVRRSCDRTERGDPKSTRGQWCSGRGGVGAGPLSRGEGPHALGELRGGGKVR